MRFIPKAGGGGGGAGSAPPVVMARAPIATDDVNAGYFIGQHWIDTSVAPVQAYVATDVSVGAAIWQEVTSFDELNAHLADLANPHQTSLANIIGLNSVGDLVITKPGAPDVDEDSTEGWVVGDHWFDNTSGVIYVIEDTTIGFAVWNPINRIFDGTVTNAKLADMNQRTFKGRDFGSNGPPQDLTRAQATDLMETFTDVLQGVVPSSGGGSANFLRADGFFALPPDTVIDRFDVQADQFEFPVSGDQPASIDGLAPTETDNVSAGLQVLSFDDTNEEARVWSRRIFAGALTMTIKALWRAKTTPGDALHDIGWKLYWREIPIGVAPSATWAGTNDGLKTLTEIVNITDDVLFHEASEVITLASEGILLDREYQFMLSRVAPAGTNLVGDWLIRRLLVEIV